MALDICARNKPPASSLYKTDKIEPLGEVCEILKFARAQTRTQAPNLQHPQVCIDVIEEGIVSGPDAGLSKERKAFQHLLKSDTCKSLVHVFFARRGTMKVPGVTDLGLKPRQIRKVAIVGGGPMGSRIATALILNGYEVVLKEVTKKFLDAGIGRVKANLTGSVKKGKLTRETFEKTTSCLKGVLDYERFKDVDMVIEAVTENVSLKQQIFSDLENLAHVMPLLEIVRTSKTSPQTVVDLLDVAKKIRKTPVVVGNCTGFAVNRMFFPYTQAALLLVERGADVYKIDRAITKFGFDIAVATGSQFVYRKRCVPHSVLQAGSIYKQPYRFSR
ncbi:putative isomerase, 3-hydroxyacyl-CoA dehydrogenase, Enoyl-CoA hydratase [Helianthus annuus]|nr:putative isomerase, 3-hydroxyacyl-CoA dehydrogenase, Enoyl-CoA hydratase [Helianthus annuus]